MKLDDISDMDDIRSSFFEKFSIPKGEKEQPYIILFDALTGMGKSTISLKLAKLDGSIILNNDEIRRYLDEKELNYDLLYDLQKERLIKLLENHNSCILDNCLTHNWEKKLDMINKLGYKYYIIRLVCSEDTIKERLDKRVLSETNFSLAKFDTYLELKNTTCPVPDELIDFTIDTEGNVDKSINEFIDKYLK